MLAAGLIFAVLAGVFWRIRSLPTDLRSKRKQPPASRPDSNQPWDVDKDDGRGNR